MRSTFIIFPSRSFAFLHAHSLDQNYASAPIFLCGPWKEGDESWRQNYKTAVFGLCERVLRIGDHASLDWVAHLKASRAAVPSSRQLGNWSSAQFGLETWENMVFTDSWHRFVHHASLVAYHASLLREDDAKAAPARRELLRMAVALYDEILEDTAPVVPLPVSAFSASLYNTFKFP